MTRGNRRASGVAAVVASLLPFSASAQHDRGLVCDGMVVSRVDIHASPPPFAGASERWQHAARTMGLHHSTTHDNVVSAFLSLSVGGVCSEFRRAESERVLRAQPFLADAVVRVEPDTGGMVAIVVSTTDEVPVLLNARFRGIAPQSLLMGNDNLMGEALLVEGRLDRGGAYRLGVGGRVEADAFLGRPYRFSVDGDRFRVGQLLAVDIEHPIFTDLQRISWHVGVVDLDNVLPFERPAGDPLVLEARDRSWDASGLLRLFGSRTVGLLGGAVAGRRFDPAANGEVMDDAGIHPDTGIALNGRYQPFRVTRVGVLGGVRRVSFRSVNGFDALVGSQDVPYGANLGLYVAHGIAQLGESDIFLSSALYAGAAWSRAWIATLAQVEGRRDPVTNGWNSVVGSSRSALYLGSAPGVVLVVADELSGGKDSRLPLQLSFRDPAGGIIGYRSSGLAGERRNVVRGEMRFSGESVLRRADLGVATFAEMGTLWAGDAPYGVSATRASVGVSLLGAYPSRSKRLYRADIGFPLTRSGSGHGGVEVRFSSVDRTQVFWTEPDDVARARTGTEPSRMFAWPTR